MPPYKEILSEISSGFNRANQKKLRKINDRVLKAAVIDFSKELYQIAVISYVLSKIVSKPRYLRKERAKFMLPIEKKLNEIAKKSDRLTPEQLQEEFSALETTIKNLEADDPRFIIDLMTKGKLKVAATLYAQGISLGLAAETTGMNKQDILNYAGKTMMFDRIKEEQSITDRVKNARKLISEG